MNQRSSGTAPAAVEHRRAENATLVDQQPDRVARRVVLVDEPLDVILALALEAHVEAMPAPVVVELQARALEQAAWQRDRNDARAAGDRLTCRLEWVQQLEAFEHYLGVLRHRAAEGGAFTLEEAPVARTPVLECAVAFALGPRKVGVDIAKRPAVDRCRANHRAWRAVVLRDDAEAVIDRRAVRKAVRGPAKPRGRAFRSVQDEFDEVTRERARVAEVPRLVWRRSRQAHFAAERAPERLDARVLGNRVLEHLHALDGERHASGRAARTHGHIDSAKSSRPISMRRISDVPAPISYSLASRHSRPVG